jgi:ATP-dependent RNA helicase RhlB
MAFFCILTPMEKNSHLTDLRFSSLPLHDLLQKGLGEAGFEFCTAVQAQALPLMLEGIDVAAQAQTGTGKTAAFLLALFDRLLRNPPPPTREDRQPRAFILAPTRELAIQIHKDAELLGQFTEFRMALAYGGTDYEKQRRNIADGVDILIGTPGRLIDYFKQRVYDLRMVEVAVLDEADRMFDLGFISDVRYLVRRMPPPERRLSMLFSATLTLRVNELAYEHMNNPRSINAAPEKKTADQVQQSVYHPAQFEKASLLVGLLRELQPTRSMVFVNTKHVASRLEATLLANQVDAGLLSGDVPQRKRQRLLEQFRNGELKVLIATDVAARGLHIADVTHVFNYDLPQQAEDYVHRIGRTARAGQSGAAISFACEEYAFSLPEIEDYVGRKLPHAQISETMLPELNRPPRKPRKTPRPDHKGAPRRRRSRPRATKETLTP